MMWRYKRTFVRPGSPKVAGMTKLALLLVIILTVLAGVMAGWTWDSGRAADGTDAGSLIVA